MYCSCCVCVACLSASMPACLPTCLHACMLACVSACLPTCLPACLPACHHACMLACVRACEPACLPACERASLHAFCSDLVHTVYQTASPLPDLVLSSHLFPPPPPPPPPFQGHFKVVKYLVDHVSQFPSDADLTRCVHSLLQGTAHMQHFLQNILWHYELFPVSRSH